jgi:hypothetical protein
MLSPRPRETSGSSTCGLACWSGGRNRKRCSRCLRVRSPRPSILSNRQACRMEINQSLPISPISSLPSTTSGSSRRKTAQSSTAVNPAQAAASLQRNGPAAWSDTPQRSTGHPRLALQDRQGQQGRARQADLRPMAGLLYPGRDRGTRSDSTTNRHRSCGRFCRTRQSCRIRQTRRFPPLGAN